MDANRAECSDLKASGAPSLEDRLYKSTEDLDKVAEISTKNVKIGEAATFTKGLLNKAGNKEMLRCLKAEDPNLEKEVKCDVALDVMKTKFGCDLRGAEGIEAAFAGEQAINTKPDLADLGTGATQQQKMHKFKEFQEGEGKGFGSTKQFTATCDRVDRLAEEMPTRGRTCPASCTKEALKELKECVGVKPEKVFYGKCDDGSSAESIEKTTLEPSFRIAEICSTAL